MTDIEVKITSERKIETPYRRFAGMQGDTGYRLKFDVKDIYSDDSIYRVEWYGAADSFTQTILLDVSDGMVYANVPTDIVKAGGTATAYLIEEKVVNDEVVERVCTYPIRLYLGNKPTGDNSVAVGEYERNVTDMYLAVVNAKQKQDEQAKKASDAFNTATVLAEEARQDYEAVAGDIQENKAGIESIKTDIDRIDGDLSGHSRSISEHSELITGLEFNKADKDYVENLMSGAVKRAVVAELPTKNIDTNTIYMIPTDAEIDNNVYNEFIYINEQWEQIGSTAVDLSDYATKEELINKTNIPFNISIYRNDQYGFEVSWNIVQDDGTIAHPIESIDLSGHISNDSFEGIIYLVNDNNEWHAAIEPSGKYIECFSWCYNINLYNQFAVFPVAFDYFYNAEISNMISEINNLKDRKANKANTKNILDSVLETNSEYYLGDVSADTALSFPSTAEIGDTIYINFTCASQFALTINTTYTSDIDIDIEEGVNYEIFATFNGSIWILGYNEYTVS